MLNPWAVLFFLLTVAVVLSIVEPRDRRWRHLFLMLLVVVPFNMCLAFALLKMVGSAGYRYDEYFYEIDRCLGSPSWWVARLLNSLPWLKAVARFDYECSIVISIFAMTACTILRGPGRGWRFLGACVSVGGFIPPFYRFIPASGPAYAFKGFPYALPTFSHAQAIVLHAAPNCMPSAHFALALLVAVSLREWKLGRWLGALHVILTTASTLGLGEHYAIDLISAVPYTAIIVTAFGLVRRPVESGASALPVPVPAAAASLPSA